MIVIGLTGSIGMGKSTAAGMLERIGIPVLDSDEVVHQSLKPGAKGTIKIGAAFPYSKYPEIYGPKNKSGKRGINRKALGKIVFADNAKRKKLESILHPLVQDAQREFIKRQEKLERQMVALDIPLLFETSAQKRVDYTIVVTAPAAIQKKRVLARPNMDEKKFRAILKNQMPDREKRKRADYVVRTGSGKAQTMKELKKVVADIWSTHS
jgi:dephospho-CoA kinase